MRLAWLGAAVGLLGASGFLLIVRATVPVRPDLATRVLPFVRDVLPASRSRGSRVPVLDYGSLGSRDLLRTLLLRAEARVSVEEFRTRQLAAAVVGALLGAGAAGLWNWANPTATIAPLWPVLALASATSLVPRVRLTLAARRRDARALSEFAVVAEILLLAIEAGESPIEALDRVARRTRTLAADLAGIARDARAGEPLGAALDRYAGSARQVPVARFFADLAVAVDRGAPLVEVLQAQARDVREERRRQLVGARSRRLVAVAAPVLLLVVPAIMVAARAPEIDVGGWFTRAG
jgi:tight adherence protein C